MAGTPKGQRALYSPLTGCPILAHSLWKGLGTKKRTDVNLSMGRKDAGPASPGRGMGMPR
jgi:hypothetical protein